jgi:uncharacterized protein
MLLMAAPFAWAIAAAQPPSAILPNGTYRYEISVDGAVIGESTIVVSRERGLIVVGESVSAAGVALVTERKIDDATFAVESYTADAGPKHVVVSVTGNAATIRQGSANATITAAPGAPLVISDNMVAGIALVPATLHATGAKSLTLASVAGGFVAVPVNVTASADGRLTLSLGGQTATLSYDPRTFVLSRLEVASSKTLLALKSYDARIAALPSPVAATPVPLPSAHYQPQDVSILADDGVKLAGTLTIPAAAATPMPGFVFVHGSGCIDRDETIGPNKIFAQLANRLSNDGYAVLRYDKRSCAKSGGNFPTRNRLIADARDAIAYLRAQPGIDSQRIFVLGHSEGGELAPSIAIADGHLRGIVLLAPPALPLEQILLQQLLRNVPGSDRAADEEKYRAELDAIAAGKKSGADAAWMRSSFGIDPAAIITKVPSPILIVQGEKDIQVLAADTPRLVNAARAANRQITVVMLPDDDHLFIKLAPNDSSTGAEYFVPSYLDPGLFGAIETWLAALAAPQR